MEGAENGGRLHGDQTPTKAKRSNRNQSLERGKISIFLAAVKINGIGLGSCGGCG